MTEIVYKKLLDVMKKRGEPRSSVDISEYYEMAEELFTPEEAEINNAFPRGPFTAKDLAIKMDRDESEIEDILEAMENKGLCTTVGFDGAIFYQGARFAIAYLNFNFFLGKNSAKAK